MTLRAPLIINAGTRARATDLLTWSNTLPPGIVANPVPPISNTDWPNPLPLRTDAGINRTWIHVQQLTPAIVNPFSGPDFPNPPPQLQNLDLRSWSKGLPPGAIATTLPPRNQDFPNPAAQRPNLELRFWWNPAIQPLAVPFSQTDWPNPLIGKANLELRTWWQSPAVPPFVQLPFNQSDWQNPFPQAPNLELRAWYNGLPTGQINQQLPPIAQYDWPNPTPLPPNLELRAWIQTYSDQAPAPTPPAVVDTHDPRLKRRRRFDDSAQTQVIRESQLKPKKIKKTDATQPTQPPPLVKDLPEDEEILAQLVAAEDQAIASTIEEAMTLLKTIH